MPKIEFKPCPFCGESQHIYCSLVTHHDDYPIFRVTCGKCYATMTGTSEEEAVKKWDKRA